MGWKTIAARGDMRAIETRRDIVGDRPVGSYLGFWQYLEATQVSFVLRQNQGTHLKFQDSEGRESARPERGLSGCRVQGGDRPLGAGPRRTPGNWRRPCGCTSNG